MADNSAPHKRSAIWNLPNQLTISRLILSMILFALISLHWYKTAFGVFLVAASTDWLDGYFARKYGMVTMLGRILDPFVDKVIICGTFIFLVAEPNSGIHAAVAVLVAGRELLITAIRSFLESRGADFSASMSGKLKMVFQCVAAGWSLVYLAWRSDSEIPPPNWIEWGLPISVALAVILTIYSGAGYVYRAVHLARE